MSAEEMKRGIRTAYADGAYTGAGQVARLVEFDRMIAEVERAAAEKAWWEACVRIADGESNLDIADTYQKQNPYLEEAPNEWVYF